MTPRGIDDFLVRLRVALRRHGVDDRRLVDEVREHLADAVEEGLGLGHSVEEAERRATERFGSPEMIADMAVAGRRNMSRVTALLDSLWHRRWWVAAPTVVAVAVTSALSYWYLPTRYRSQATIRVERVARGVGVGASADAAAADAAVREADARLQRIAQHILTSSQLETVARDFGLHEAKEWAGPVGDTARRMRQDIALELLPPGGPQAREFRVSFVSANPTVAMQVTERLVSLFVKENLVDRQWVDELEKDVLARQIDDVRRRLIALEATLRARRGRGDGQSSQADLIPYDVLKERYRALLVQAEDLRGARPAVGEQFRVVDRPSLPQEPVGPSRLTVNLAGAGAGLGLGLVLAALRGRSKAVPLLDAAG